MRVSNQESQESSAKSWVVVEVEPFEVYFSLRSGHNIQLFACSALVLHHTQFAKAAFSTSLRFPELPRC